MSGVTRRALVGALFALVVQPLAGRAAAPPWAIPPDDPLTVFAAADLAQPFGELAPTFERARGIPVRMVFGSSGSLALQIEHGAPADLFFAANVAFVDGLRAKGLTVAGSQRVYARGHLVLASPARAGRAIGSLADLRRAGVGRIAIANPETAPYGKAAREALERSRLWSVVRSRIVYGENARHTLQLVQSGAVDAAILSATAAREPGIRTVPIDERLHAPIDQAAAVIAASPRQREAREFLAFVVGAEGRTVMARYGFSLPEAR